ncbi:MULTISPECIES: glucose-1-phosphate adenylyltransferase [Methylovorus]|jgi:glucose-1-phosphate adenylyltransferase|uniref:Glucose-1-phosphate adenylyltransferase n=1 Tax=Methylovorus glucosotrophus (strain SIP3-4) TaxID=582744 RepID=C6XD92_METGS|nr:MULTISPECIES: glucose-1-phosphate adenylyltransferase [Methylovorus]ACT50517.1 glucose-1-phosphate adenylyltransferase [Methylovorus glucosotrophus SIP3-4]ADQ84507.1 glucose-1-phosphate adenylyltransferase [Methylovorus sp. MP688]MCB4811855.1 glucose-1-phosphate adenylyltransferase [Methylovorus menthalis]HWU35587.1 glucose-1-phosphate adenylyltransferase [Methylovorus sp.]
MHQDLTSTRFISALTKNTVALILAGGKGSRLKDLTNWRAKPAVPFGGKFRIIDFPLSNCMNSGVRRIGVVTQYKSHSLMQHIQRGWGFLRGEFNEFVELLPAQQRIQEEWYKGTADAVFQNLDILRNTGAEYVLILAGDHIYKMDYGQMLASHVKNKADMTVACVNVPVEDAKAFGVMGVDDEDRVIDFSEKPDNPKPLPDNPDQVLASMGIYVFNASFLYEQLIRDADAPHSQHDFGRDIIPYMIKKYRVYAHRFTESCVGASDGNYYWRDVGTVDAYWEANMELTKVIPELNLYDRHWPIWTYQEQLPPAKFVFDNADRCGMATDSLVSGGCIISGAKVSRSVLFSDIRVNSYSNIEDSVILPKVDIGRYVTLKRVVVDKGTRIPDGMEIGVNPEQDRKRFYVSEKGITLVTPDMLGQSIHQAR